MIRSGEIPCVLGPRPLTCGTDLPVLLPAAETVARRASEERARGGPSLRLKARHGVWLFLALLCTIGLRPRYFLPAQPFLMYQLLVGLMVVVRTLLPRASAKAALTASIVFVIVILGFGSARIAKQIYQFQMANFSGRPMEYLEGGHYAGVRRTADFVGEYWHDHPDLGEPILLFGEGVSILHYWTGRVIGMPDRPGDPLNEDAALYEYLTSHSLLIAYQEPKGPAGRLEEVRDWLDRREGAEQLYEADGWRIYRTGGETPPGS